MIDFLEDENNLKHARTLVLTYPRTISIVCGKYPFKGDLHNFIVEIENNLSSDLYKKTNVKGSMTDWNFFNTHPLFIKFFKYVVDNEKAYRQYFKNYNPGQLKNAWGNKITKGDNVQSHKHDSLHGVLYLTEGNPLHLEEVNLNIYPKPGDYYIFPPEIYHRVDEHTGEKNRYNLIFNFREKYISE